MSLTIAPDPKRPHGGYAVLSLPADRLAGADEVAVAVFDAFSERYLGAADWQAERAEFGPYPVTVAGDTAMLVIGPEIVNQVEEYAVLDLTVGPVTEQVSWPDTVVPKAGAAVLGTLRTADAKPVAPRDNLVGKAAPDPEPAPPEPDPEPEAVPDPAPARGRGPAIAVALLVLAALAGGAAWYLTRPTAEDPPAPVAAVPAPDPAPAPAPVAAAPDGCAAESLLALRGAFAEIGPVIAGCGGRAEPDTALTVVENAAAAGDADALLLFGALYDGATLRPEFGEVIGLTFGDAPARAAEYYFRARQAGSAEATPLLAAVCARLSTMTDTLSRGASDDYCQ